MTKSIFAIFLITLSIEAYADERRAVGKLTTVSTSDLGLHFKLENTIPEVCRSSPGQWLLIKNNNMASIELMASNIQETFEVYADYESDGLNKNCVVKQLNIKSI